MSLNKSDPRLMIHTEASRTGGDPSFLFDLMIGVYQEKEWNDDEYIDFMLTEYPDGAGLDIAYLKRIFKVNHRFESEQHISTPMKSIREAIKRRINKDDDIMPPLGDVGGDRKSEEIKVTCNVDFPIERGNNSTYTLRRLKRDNPDIAQRVIDGELTPTEGARMAGIRPNNRQVNMDDPVKAATAIWKHMSMEHIRELIDYLDVKWNSNE